MRTDARRLRQDQLTALRKRGVAAVQNGGSPEAIARVLGVHRTTVYGWLSLYRAGGWGELDARKRGGRRPKLTGTAMAWIFKTVARKDPRHFDFPFALWTSRVVGEVIEQRFGLRLSRASVCRLLNQLGLSAPRPLWRASQQDPARVDRWLRAQYPAIRAAAKRQKAELWFEDEAGVRSDAPAGTSWAPRGRTPVGSTTGARFGLTLISAVSPQGHFRFMGVKGRVNAGVFIEFLRRLVHHARRKIFLIVEGHPPHKAAQVQRFVASVAERLELFFLPPDAPDLNPDEGVGNDLKHNAIGRRAITGPDRRKRAMLS